MLQSVAALKSLVATSRRKTESIVFYLHYRATFLLLMFSCLIITTRQFVGEKIECYVSPAAELPTALINTYCWATSTYSVSGAYLKEVGVEVPHPGLGGSQNETDYIYRNYYQYVHLLLFIQAMLFYLPHFIWKGVDRIYMTGFYDVIDNAKNRKSKGNPDAVDISKNKKSKGNPDAFETAATYIEERWGSHNEYASEYIICEVLALINLLAQSYLLDLFLHGQFLGLGLFYASHYNADRFSDPIALFPLVTSCYFKKYGASGYADTVDALCVLPINALNVKIYLLVWVWFAVLLGLSIGNLLVLFAFCFVPRSRVLLSRISSLLDGSRIDGSFYMNCVGNGNFGDWFILSGIRSNMDKLDFSNLMECLWPKLSDLEETTNEP